MPLGHWFDEEAEAEQFPSVESVRRVPVLVTKTKETLLCLFVCLFLVTPNSSIFLSLFSFIFVFFS